LQRENDDSLKVCTDFAQVPRLSPDGRVKFPVTIKHRAERARIYAPKGKFAYYRVA
jgi:hypothetical protein